MTKTGRIILALIIAVLLAAVLFAGLFIIWARPDRLTQSESRDLIKLAWETSQNGSLTGTKVIEYRLGTLVYRVKTDLSDSQKFAELKLAVSGLFPQVMLTDEFISNFTLRHMGRARSAGRNCERIRLSPSYIGDSVELWIDPETGYLIAWRKLDSDGALIRGSRFISITGHSTSSASEPGGILREMGLFTDRQLMPSDKVDDLIARKHLVLPEILPSGFKLIGVRPVPGFAPPGELDELFPGQRIGRMRGQMEMTPGVGVLQSVYSDGLNTITLIQMPFGRVMQIFANPDKINGVLAEKKIEIHRVFHTAMSFRFLPNGLILLYGDIDPKLLEQVAASIPEIRIETPIEEMFPPPFSEMPPGPGMDPNMGAGDGFEPGSGMGPGGGMGPGSGRGPGMGPGGGRGPGRNRGYVHNPDEST